MALESLTGINGKTYEIGFRLRVFDEASLELALDDLQSMGLFGVEGETYKDNTMERNLETLVLNLDSLANFRGSETYDLLSCGVELLR